MTNKASFFAKIKAGSIGSWTKYKVLPSLVAAQAILESGWGGSGLTQKANNLFGVKADSSWKGPTVSLPTREVYGGKSVTVQAKWRKYTSWNASVEDHGLFLNQHSRYKKLLGETNYKTAARLIREAGYATDPNYTSSLIAVIESNDLYNWDKEAFKAKGSASTKRTVKKAVAKASSKKTYVVKAGDTVSGIAVKCNTSIDKIKKLNPSIKNINNIFVGEKIRVK